MNEYPTKPQAPTRKGARAHTIPASGGDPDAWIDAFNILATSRDDSRPPVVRIMRPAHGTTVSHTVTVAARASDDVGVAGVQFVLDGKALGREDTSPPYAVSWDTTATANGMHTLTAVARDTAGNRTTSLPLRIPVANGAGPKSAAHVAGNRPGLTT